MSNKRGSRGKSKGSSIVVLKIRDEERLHRTLDLLGIVGDKPHINDIMPRIVARMDDEEYQKSLALARSWQRHMGGDWSRQMIYECMGEDYPGWDDEVGYDPYEEIYDGLMSKGCRKLKELNKKLFKKGKKGKHRYNRGSEDDDYWENRHTMFTSGEWSDDDNMNGDDGDYEEPYKCIKFYDDIENELSVQEFYSLKMFNDFCDDNGYYISSTDYNNLMNNSVIHCCLDPISKESGENEIITDTSYGGLYWTVSDDITKKSEQSALGARTY